MAQTAINLLDQPPEPSDQMLSEIIFDLGLSASPKAEKLKHLLNAHAISFAMGRLLQEQSPTIHEDRALAKEVASQIRALLDNLEDFSPIIGMLIKQKFDEESSKDQAWKGLAAELARLEAMTQRIGGGSLTKKQPDAVLKNAVGGLMLLLELATGNRANTRPRQSQKNVPAELSSPEARAIGALLKVGQPTLSGTVSSPTLLTVDLRS